MWTFSWEHVKHGSCGPSRCLSGRLSSEINICQGKQNLSRWRIRGWVVYVTRGQIIWQFSIFMLLQMFSKGGLYLPLDINVCCPLITQKCLRIINESLCKTSILWECPYYQSMMKCWAFNWWLWNPIEMEVVCESERWRLFSFFDHEIKFNQSTLSPVHEGCKDKQCSQWLTWVRSCLN